jgi:hypothetical protein
VTNGAVTFKYIGGTGFLGPATVGWESFIIQLLDRFGNEVTNATGTTVSAQFISAGVTPLATTTNYLGSGQYNVSYYTTLASTVNLINITINGITYSNNMTTVAGDSCSSYSSHYLL